MRIRRPTVVAGALVGLVFCAAPASAAVQNVSVKFGASDSATTVAGETVAYRITFDVPAGLGDDPGDYVEVDASGGAAGTIFPPGPPVVVPGGQLYTVQVQGMPPGPIVGPDTAVVRTNGDQTVRVPLQGSGLDAAAGATLRLIIGGVQSPFVPGMYTLDVSTSADTAGTSATYEVVEGPGAVLVQSGSEQTATVGEAFADPLVAKVLDGMGDPASGADVTFTAPASGPSGTFAGSGTRTETVATDGSGIATSSTLTANGEDGDWEVTATGPSDETPATFKLENETGEAAAIDLQLNPASIEGNGVSTGTATAHVTDEFGNPISGETVTITTDGSQDVSAVTGGANGNYSAFITSSPMAETATITATDTTPAPDLTATAELTQTADVTGPDVVITKHPNARTKRKHVEFRFEQQDPDVDFLECKLDKDDWEACSSPREYKVRIGKHKFKVRATDLAGNTGDPDRYKFERIRR
jgi:hypothetical protein